MPVMAVKSLKAHFQNVKYLITYFLIYLLIYLLTHPLTNLLTYLLTPWSRALLEKLTSF